MSVDLKKCPFCSGDTPEIYKGMYTMGPDDIPSYYFYVGTIHAETEWFDTAEEAIEAWNRRPTEDALQADVTRLAAAVENNGKMVQSQKEARLRAEAAVRAMWEVFARALDYTEHPSDRALHALNEACRPVRENGIEHDMLDTILGIADSQYSKNKESS